MKDLKACPIDENFHRSSEPGRFIDIYHTAGSSVLFGLDHEKEDAEIKKHARLGPLINLDDHFLAGIAKGAFIESRPPVYTTMSDSIGLLEEKMNFFFQAAGAQSSALRTSIQRNFLQSIRIAVLFRHHHDSIVPDKIYELNIQTNNDLVRFNANIVYEFVLDGMNKNRHAYGYFRQALRLKYAQNFFKTKDHIDMIRDLGFEV